MKGERFTLAGGLTTTLVIHLIDRSTSEVRGSGVVVISE